MVGKAGQVDVASQFSSGPGARTRTVPVPTSTVAVGLASRLDRPRPAPGSSTPLDRGHARPVVVTPVA